MCIPGAKTDDKTDEVSFVDFGSWNTDWNSVAPIGQIRKIEDKKADKKTDKKGDKKGEKKGKKKGEDEENDDVTADTRGGDFPEPGLEITTHPSLEDSLPMEIAARIGYEITDVDYYDQSQETWCTGKIQWFPPVDTFNVTISKTAEQWVGLWPTVDGTIASDLATRMKDVKDENAYPILTYNKKCRERNEGDQQVVRGDRVTISDGRPRWTRPSLALSDAFRQHSVIADQEKRASNLKWTIDRGGGFRISYECLNDKDGKRLPRGPVRGKAIYTSPAESESGGIRIDPGVRLSKKSMAKIAYEEKKLKDKKKNENEGNAANKTDTMKEQRRGKSDDAY